MERMIHTASKESRTCSRHMMELLSKTQMLFALFFGMYHRVIEENAVIVPGAGQGKF